ncbi:MAG: TetR/AcrR family transcriptional regulator [Deltaproteobacteria bacterium]|nr:MAG: TetR/AcrR family transcriptional regulator [Deltaproteobacteria bacterium]TMB42981.1 MAG: TetR/AcrR family transcriptional regulator [Deltaproteobacteria bacterium]
MGPWPAVGLTNERSFGYPRTVRAKAPSRPEASPAVPTREAILDAAERLFSARGVDGVAVRDLAREMSLTPSSLYNHFPGKQALYEAVLERGLRPIVDLVAGAAPPGVLGPAQLNATIERLTRHLAVHPHLARLLQRALLEDGKLQAAIGRWASTLYGQGVAVLRAGAVDAGWEPTEVPHLALGLFGIIFAYFTNAPAVRALAGSKEDPFSARALAVQRRFLEKAVYRLLGPQPRRRRPRP